MSGVHINISKNFRKNTLQIDANKQSRKAASTKEAAGPPCTQSAPLPLGNLCFIALATAGTAVKAKRSNSKKGMKNIVINAKIA